MPQRLVAPGADMCFSPAHIRHWPALSPAMACRELDSAISLLPDCPVRSFTVVSGPIGQLDNAIDCRIRRTSQPKMHGAREAGVAAHKQAALFNFAFDA